MKQLRVFLSRLLFFGATALTSFSANAATTNVTVGPGTSYSPPVVRMGVGDTVVWNWAGAGHSVTHAAIPRLFNSGTLSPPATFSHRFAEAGSFRYFCTTKLHFNQTGTVVITAANLPPTVAIVTPTNGSVFAAPATFSLLATATDTDGTVTNVAFFRDSTFLNNASASPFRAADSNVPAGTYDYSAVASDNAGDKATNQIAIRVVTPVAIRLSNPQQLSPTSFSFSYTANAGLTYVVERSEAMVQWQRIGTNVASAANNTFTDNAAPAGQSFYRVLRE